LHGEEITSTERESERERERERERECVCVCVRERERERERERGRGRKKRRPCIKTREIVDEEGAEEAHVRMHMLVDKISISRLWSSIARLRDSQQ